MTISISGIKLASCNVFFFLRFLLHQAERANVRNFDDCFIAHVSNHRLVISFYIDTIK